MNILNSVSEGRSLRKPLQTIPTKEKLSDSKEGENWRKSNVDYYASRTNFLLHQRQHLKELYKRANGYINESDYSYILNPNNVNKTRTLPSKLRNYDIITGIVQMFMGEISKREIIPTVKAINSDIISRKEAEYVNLINEQLEQFVVNTINEIQETDLPSKPIMENQQIQGVIDSIKDENSIEGQISMEYLTVNCEVLKKSRYSFYDQIVTGYKFTERNIKHDDVFYDILSPTDCGYICSENTVYVEDGEAAWVRRYVTLSDIIQDFYDEFTEQEIKELEENHKQNQSDYTLSINDTDIFIKNLRDSGIIKQGFPNSELRNDQYEVVYVNWKSKVKIGKVTGINVLGESYEYEVDEHYKPLKNESITWMWVDQLWEGYRIANTYYKKVRPVEAYRGKLDNPSSCKLLINGTTIYGRHYLVKSPVEKLIPYQEKYNILHWHLEKVINKNKNKLVFLPKQLIPDDEDMDMFDMMHYADADGFLFGDEITNEQQAAANAIKVIDLSLGEYIRQLYEGLAFIKQEAEDMLGITRQRKGQTFASDLKSVTEQSIYQSAIISEEFFLEHEEYIERDLKALLDLSKHAWRKGKKKHFITTDNREMFLNIDEGKSIQSIEYSLDISNGRKQAENTNAIRQQAQAFIQNANKPSIVAKLFEVNSVDKMIKYLEEEEEAMMQRSQQAQEAENQIEKERLEFEKYKVELEASVKRYEVDMERLTELDKLDAKDSDGIEQQKINLEREKLYANVQIEREKIAGMLKNPVVGEVKRKETKK